MHRRLRSLPRPHRQRLPAPERSPPSSRGRHRPTHCAHPARLHRRIRLGSHHAHRPRPRAPCDCCSCCPRPHMRPSHLYRYFTHARVPSTRCRANKYRAIAHTSRRQRLRQFRARDPHGLLHPRRHAPQLRSPRERGDLDRSLLCRTLRRQAALGGSRSACCTRDRSRPQKPRPSTRPSGRRRSRSRSIDSR